ncbi:MAG: hypothetical protein ACRCZZ_01840 [Phocaeicola sp.]
MKTKTIKRALFASFLTATLGFSSCLKEDNTPFFTEIGTVCVASSGNTLPVVDGDIYGKSTITNKEALSYYDADTVGQRIMYTFTEDETSQSVTTDQIIRIHELYRVLTKPMDTLKDGEEDVYGDAKINIIKTYLSKEHLNIQFQIFTQDRTIKHRISLVDTKNAHIDEEGYIELEFRHNPGKDKESELNWGLVSYTLSSIPGYSDKKLKGFKIKYNSIYEGEKTRKIDLETSKQPSGLRMNENAPFIME